MHEFLFPTVALLAVWLVVMPATSALAKGILVGLERYRAMHLLDLRLLVLLSAPMLPLLGVFVAATRLNFSQTELSQCAFDDHGLEACHEPSVLALGIAIAVFVVTSLAALIAVNRRGVFSLSKRPELLARIERVVREHHMPHTLGLIWLTDEPIALAAVGQRIIVNPEFAAGLSDDLLASGLAHEYTHLESGDPLRYFLLDASRRLNPLGHWLLAPHIARWFNASEVHCDRNAVLSGACPLALAEVIVRAARSSHGAAGSVPNLEGGAIHFRVHLLLAYAERAPIRCCRDKRVFLQWSGGVVVATLVLGAALLPPALSWLHAVVETFATHWTT